MERNFLTGTAVQSPESLELMLEEEDFETFREVFESGYHANFHNFVDGDMLTMLSPNDPVCFNVFNGYCRRSSCIIRLSTKYGLNGSSDIRRTHKIIQGLITVATEQVLRTK